MQKLIQKTLSILVVIATIFGGLNLPVNAIEETTTQQDNIAQQEETTIEQEETTVEEEETTEVVEESSEVLEMKEDTEVDEEATQEVENIESRTSDTPTTRSPKASDIGWINPTSTNGYSLRGWWYDTHTENSVNFIAYTTNNGVANKQCYYGHIETVTLSWTKNGQNYSHEFFSTNKGSAPKTETDSGSGVTMTTHKEDGWCRDVSWGNLNETKNVKLSITGLEPGITYTLEETHNYNSSGGRKSFPTHGNTFTLPKTTVERNGPMKIRAAHEVNEHGFVIQQSTDTTAGKVDASKNNRVKVIPVGTSVAVYEGRISPGTINETLGLVDVELRGTGKLKPYTEYHVEMTLYNSAGESTVIKSSGTGGGGPFRTKDGSINVSSFGARTPAEHLSYGFIARLKLDENKGGIMQSNQNNTVKITEKNNPSKVLYNGYVGNNAGTHHIDLELRDLSLISERMKPFTSYNFTFNLQNRDGTNQPAFTKEMATIDADLSLTRPVEIRLVNAYDFIIRKTLNTIYHPGPGNVENFGRISKDIPGKPNMFILREKVSQKVILDTEIEKRHMKDMVVDIHPGHYIDPLTNKKTVLKPFTEYEVIMTLYNRSGKEFTRIETVKTNDGDLKGNIRIREQGPVARPKEIWTDRVILRLDIDQDTGGQIIQPNAIHEGKIKISEGQNPNPIIEADLKSNINPQKFIDFDTLNSEKKLNHYTLYNVEMTYFNRDNKEFKTTGQFRTLDKDLKPRDIEIRKGPNHTGAPEVSEDYAVLRQFLDPNDAGKITEPYSSHKGTIEITEDGKTTPTIDSLLNQDGLTDGETLLDFDTRLSQKKLLPNTKYNVKTIVNNRDEKSFLGSGSFYTNYLVYEETKLDGTADGLLEVKHTVIHEDKVATKNIEMPSEYRYIGTGVNKKLYKFEKATVLGQDYTITDAAAFKTAVGNMTNANHNEKIVYEYKEIDVPFEYTSHGFTYALKDVDKLTFDDNNTATDVKELSAITAKNTDTNADLTDDIKINGTSLTNLQNETTSGIKKLSFVTDFVIGGETVKIEQEVNVYLYDEEETIDETADHKYVLSSLKEFEHNYKTYNITNLPISLELKLIDLENGVIDQTAIFDITQYANDIPDVTPYNVEIKNTANGLGVFSDILVTNKQAVIDFTNNPGATLDTKQLNVSTTPIDVLDDVSLWDEETTDKTKITAIPATIPTNKKGVYTVKYTFPDRWGIEADEKTRIYYVDVQPSIGEYTVHADSFTQEVSSTPMLDIILAANASAVNNTTGDTATPALESSNPTGFDGTTVGIHELTFVAQEDTNNPKEEKKVVAMITATGSEVDEKDKVAISGEHITLKPSEMADYLQDPVAGSKVMAADFENNQNFTSSIVANQTDLDIIPTAKENLTGTYTVNFSATVNGEEATVALNIDIDRGDAPVVTVNPSYIPLNVGDQSPTPQEILSGVTVTDTEDGNTLNATTATTTIDTTSAGTQVVKYTALDSDGNYGYGYRVYVIGDSIISEGDKFITIADNFTHGYTATQENDDLAILTKANAKLMNKKTGEIILPTDDVTAFKVTKSLPEYDSVTPGSYTIDIDAEEHTVALPATITGIVTNEEPVITFVADGNPIDTDFVDYVNVAIGDTVNVHQDVSIIDEENPVITEITATDVDGIVNPNGTFTANEEGYIVVTYSFQDIHGVDAKDRKRIYKVGTDIANGQTYDLVADTHHQAVSQTAMSESEVKAVTNVYAINLKSGHVYDVTTEVDATFDPLLGTVVGTFDVAFEINDPQIPVGETVVEKTVKVTITPTDNPVLRDDILLDVKDTLTMRPSELIAFRSDDSAAQAVAFDYKTNKSLQPTSNKDTQIPTLVSSVTASTYTITYTATSLDGLRTATKDLVITITHEGGPTIDVDPAVKTLPLNAPQEDVKLGVTAKKFDDSTIDPTHISATPATIDTSASGVKVVKYTVMDNEGKKATATRVYNIGDDVIVEETDEYYIVAKDFEHIYNDTKITDKKEILNLAEAYLINKETGEELTDLDDQAILDLFELSPSTYDSTNPGDGVESTTYPIGIQVAGDTSGNELVAIATVKNTKAVIAVDMAVQEVQQGTSINVLDNITVTDPDQQNLTALAASPATIDTSDIGTVVVTYSFIDEKNLAATEVTKTFVVATELPISGTVYGVDGHSFSEQVAGTAHANKQQHVIDSSNAFAYHKTNGSDGTVVVSGLNNYKEMQHGLYKMTLDVQEDQTAHKDIYALVYKTDISTDGDEVKLTAENFKITKTEAIALQGATEAAKITDIVNRGQALALNELTNTNLKQKIAFDDSAQVDAITAGNVGTGYPLTFKVEDDGKVATFTIDVEVTDTDITASATSFYLTLAEVATLNTSTTQDADFLTILKDQQKGKLTYASTDPVDDGNLDVEVDSQEFAALLATTTPNMEGLPFTLKISGPSGDEMTLPEIKIYVKDNQPDPYHFEIEAPAFNIAKANMNNIPALVNASKLRVYEITNVPPVEVTGQPLYDALSVVTPLTDIGNLQPITFKIDASEKPTTVNVFDYYDNSQKVGINGHDFTLALNPVPVKQDAIAKAEAVAWNVVDATTPSATGVQAKIDAALPTEKGTYPIAISTTFNGVEVGPHTVQGTFTDEGTTADGFSITANDFDIKQADVNDQNALDKSGVAAVDERQVPHTPLLQTDISVMTQPLPTTVDEHVVNFAVTQETNANVDVKMTVYDEGEAVDGTGSLFANNATVRLDQITSNQQANLKHFTKVRGRDANGVVTDNVNIAITEIKDAGTVIPTITAVGTYDVTFKYLGIETTVQVEVLDTNIDLQLQKATYRFADLPSLTEATLNTDLVVTASSNLGHAVTTDVATSELTKVKNGQVGQKVVVNVTASDGQGDTTSKETEVLIVDEIDSTGEYAMIASNFTATTAEVKTEDEVIGKGQVKIINTKTHVEEDPLLAETLNYPLGAGLGIPVTYTHSISDLTVTVSANVYDDIIDIDGVKYGVRADKNVNAKVDEVQTLANIKNKANLIVTNISTGANLAPTSTIYIQFQVIVDNNPVTKLAKGTHNGTYKHGDQLTTVKTNFNIYDDIVDIGGVEYGVNALPSVDTTKPAVDDEDKIKTVGGLEITNLTTGLLDQDLIDNTLLKVGGTQVTKLENGQHLVNYDIPGVQTPTLVTTNFNVYDDIIDIDGKEYGVTASPVEKVKKADVNTQANIKIAGKLNITDLETGQLAQDKIDATKTFVGTEEVDDLDLGQHLVKYEVSGVSTTAQTDFDVYEDIIDIGGVDYGVRSIDNKVVQELDVNTLAKIKTEGQLEVVNLETNQRDTTKEQNATIKVGTETPTALLQGVHDVVYVVEGIDTTAQTTFDVFVKIDGAIAWKGHDFNIKLSEVDNRYVVFTNSGVEAFDTTNGNAPIDPSEIEMDHSITATGDGQTYTFKINDVNPANSHLHGKETTLDADVYDDIVGNFGVKSLPTVNMTKAELAGMLDDEDHMNKAVALVTNLTALPKVDNPMTAQNGTAAPLVTTVGLAQDVIFTHSSGATSTTTFNVFDDIPQGTTVGLISKPTVVTAKNQVANLEGILTTAELKIYETANNTVVEKTLDSLYRDKVTAEIVVGTPVTQLDLGIHQVKFVYDGATTDAQTIFDVRNIVVDGYSMDALPTKAVELADVQTAKAIREQAELLIKEINTDTELTEAEYDAEVQVLNSNYEAITSLEKGTHTVTFKFKDETVSTVFTIVDKIIDTNLGLNALPTKHVAKADVASKPAIITQGGAEVVNLADGTVNNAEYGNISIDENSLEKGTHPVEYKFNGTPTGVETIFHVHDDVQGGFAIDSLDTVTATLDETKDSNTLKGKAVVEVTDIATNQVEVVELNNVTAAPDKLVQTGLNQSVTFTHSGGAQTTTLFNIFGGIDPTAKWAIDAVDATVPLAALQTNPDEVLKTATQVAVTQIDVDPFDTLPNPAQDPEVTVEDVPTAVGPDQLVTFEYKGAKVTVKVTVIDTNIKLDVNNIAMSVADVTTLLASTTKEDDFMAITDLNINADYYNQSLKPAGDTLKVSVDLNNLVAAENVTGYDVQFTAVSDPSLQDTTTKTIKVYVFDTLDGDVAWNGQNFIIEKSQVNDGEILDKSQAKAYDISGLLQSPQLPIVPIDNLVITHTIQTTGPNQPVNFATPAGGLQSNKNWNANVVDRIANGLAWTADNINIEKSILTTADFAGLANLVVIDVATGLPLDPTVDIEVSHNIQDIGLDQDLTFKVVSGHVHEGKSHPIKVNVFDSIPGNGKAYLSLPEVTVRLHEVQTEAAIIAKAEVKEYDLTDLSIAPVVMTDTEVSASSDITSVGQQTITFTHTASGAQTTTIFNVLDNDVVLPPTIDPIAPGALTITGTGIAGNEILVELPDGTVLAPVVVAQDGTWSAVVPQPTVPTEVYKATQKDTQTQVESIAVEATVGNYPAVAAPVINDITPGTGSVIAGTSEANNIITVTLPDGSTLTTTADGNGNWSVTNPGLLNPGETITANAQDALTNVISPDAQKVVGDYPDVAAPTIDSMIDGDETISGTGEPGKEIIVELPDGTLLAPVTVQPDGTWEAVLPQPAEAGEEYGATQKDPTTNVESTKVTTIVKAVPEKTYTLSANDVSFTLEEFMKLKGDGKLEEQILKKSNAKAVEDTTQQEVGPLLVDASILLAADVKVGDKHQVDIIYEIPTTNGRAATSETRGLTRDEVVAKSVMKEITVTITKGGKQLPDLPLTGENVLELLLLATVVFIGSFTFFFFGYKRKQARDEE